MATAFHITADGTTIKGPEDGTITLTGRDVAERTPKIFEFIKYLLKNAGYEVKGNISDGSIAMELYKPDAEVPFAQFSEALPKLQMTMKAFEQIANTGGFDVAMADMGPDIIPARKPAALASLEKKPVTLTDEELRAAIGKGLLDANVGARQINAAVDKAMEAIQKAREEKAAPHK